MYSELMRGWTRQGAKLRNQSETMCLFEDAEGPAICNQYLQSETNAFYAMTEIVSGWPDEELYDMFVNGETKIVEYCARPTGASHELVRAVYDAALRGGVDAVKALYFVEHFPVILRITVVGKYETGRKPPNVSVRFEDVKFEGVKTACFADPKGTAGLIGPFAGPQNGTIGHADQNEDQNLRAIEKVLDSCIAGAWNRSHVDRFFDRFFTPLATRMKNDGYGLQYQALSFGSTQEEFTNVFADINKSRIKDFLTNHGSIAERREAERDFYAKNPNAGAF